MTEGMIKEILALLRDMVRQHPERSADVVRALQEGTMDALHDVQYQRGDYAGALSSLAALYCWKKPGPEMFNMTAAAVRRADGEGSCAANRNLLARLDELSGRIKERKVKP